MDLVLKVENLRVSFDMNSKRVDGVRGVSFSIGKGEILALVGESGCGKSLTARSIIKLNDSPSTITSAELILLDNINILEASEKDMLKVRGKLVGMVFQDPMTYLNPTIKVGKQVTEGLLRQGLKSAFECKKEAIRLLEMVQITDAESRAEQYPHEFSGGMRQRAMIAMALACNPKLLIADEPTTALDPTIQLEILSLLKKMQEQLKTAILIITHDLSVVANVADKVAVMYAGKIVEQSNAKELFKKPLHPYTIGLINSLPNLEVKSKLKSIQGSPPDMYKLPKGCAFSPRCSMCMEICRIYEPDEIILDNERKVACWLFHPDFPKGGV